MAQGVGGLRLFWTPAVQPHFDASRSPWLGVEPVAPAEERPAKPLAPAPEDDVRGRLIDLKV